MALWCMADISEPHDHFTAGYHGARDLEWRNLTELHGMQFKHITHDSVSLSEEQSRLETRGILNETGHGFPFLDLPQEIRLNICHWLHLMHPINHAQLTPWYPAPIFVPCISNPLRPCSRSDKDECDAAQFPRPTSTTVGHDGNGRHMTHLLSPYRPLAGLPTAFLTANKQIYRESRAIPLANNEFTFVNWFASGLWAARSFTNRLTLWQRKEMRYVKLELLSKDLTGVFEQEWQETCQSWSGVRGLRLKILCGGATLGDWVADGLPVKGAPVVYVRDAHGKVNHWVEHGIGLMGQLQNLEVELLIDGWDDEQKIDWCLTLEEALNNPLCSKPYVKVTSVESVVGPKDYTD